MPDASLILPQSPAPAAVTPIVVNRSKTSQSLSGHIRTRTQGAQLFNFRLSYPTMRPETFAPIMAFLAAQRGKDGIFFMVVDQLISGSLVQPGNFVNWSTAPEGKLYLVTGTGPTTTTPPQPQTGSADGAPTYLRCSLSQDVQTFQSDRLGFFRYEFEVQERLT